VGKQDKNSHSSDLSLENSARFDRRPAGLRAYAKVLTVALRYWTIRSQTRALRVPQVATIAAAFDKKIVNPSGKT
jgi:hypothetical protein